MAYAVSGIGMCDSMKENCIEIHTFTVNIYEMMGKGEKKKIHFDFV